jgi:hypothetical protein
MKPNVRPRPYPLIFSVLSVLTLLYHPTPAFSRGRILGRNPDKSLKNFPSCYSQSPLYSSTALSFIFLQIQATSVKKKGGKPDNNKNYTPFPIV